MKISKYQKSKICRLFSFMPDDMYLKIQYFLHMKKKLIINPPLSFNEKLQWLKLYDRKSLYIQIVDKLEVRSYIKEKIGEEYLVPLLGVWDKPENISFEKLPNSFVLKCNHDSGSVIICNDKVKLDFNQTNFKLKKSLEQNIFFNGREWPYHYVKPCIIAEELLEDTTSDDLKDYKFMCFNGEPKCVFTGTNRQNGELYITFFDLEWNRLPIERHYHNDPNEIKKPKCLTRMIELAKILAKDFLFIRVDFYEVNNRIYFGELTMFPGSGFERFNPEIWDYKFGEWLTLPIDVK